MPLHELGLAALQVADEVPAEGVAVGGVLRLEVLRAVLADHLDPGPGQRGHVLNRQVLGGCDDRHVRADFLASPAPGARRRASADNAKDALCPARPARAPLRKEEIRAAAGAEIDPFDLGRARITRGLLHGGPEVELAFADDAVPEAVSEPARDLLPHLEAARPDRGPTAAANPGPIDFSSRVHDAVDQSAPARVDDGERRLRAVRPRHRHQHAVGAESEHGDARLLRPERISRDTARAGFGSVDDGRMRLEAERERLLLRLPPPRTAGGGSRRRAPLSSPVRRPRFSDSNGPSLTPPTLVEKTTSYGPSTPTGVAARSSDQLPRGLELRFATVQLAVQLPAPELTEDLPHAGRLAETQLGEVHADLSQPHSAQALEVLVQPRRARQREGEERCVRIVPLDRGDDVGGSSPGRRWRSSAPSTIAAAIWSTVRTADLEPLEPRCDL